MTQDGNEKEIKEFNSEKLKLLLITIPLFIFITLITAKCERREDGNDTFGFPFTFYTIHSEMNTPMDENSYQSYSDNKEYNNVYLFLNIVITISFVQLILFLLRTYRKF